MPESAVDTAGTAGSVGCPRLGQQWRKNRFYRAKL
jgi:hypothetical protein